MCNYCFTGNLLLSLGVKEFENPSLFGKVRSKNKVEHFSGHGVHVQFA